MRWPEACVDLLLGAECAGCAAPGRLCDHCRHALDGPMLHRDLDGLPVLSAAEYLPPVPAMVKHFKDGGGWSLGPVFADRLVAVLHELLIEPESTLLVAVPSSRSSVRRRGFDHTAALLGAVSRRTRMPRASLLRPPSTGAVQHTLGVDERWTNQQGRFTARPGRADVVLVDDVVTTGATLLACRTALSEAGHQVLGAVTVASAQRWSAPDPPKG